MKICLLSLSAIEDDPRVRRQGDAFAAAGHDVVGVGLEGARSEAPAWPVIHCPDRRRGQVGNALLAARGAVSSILNPVAQRVFWSLRHSRPFLRAAQSTEAELFVANDWWVLPVAGRAASFSGSPFCYDTHEYAIEENAHSPIWNATMPRFIASIEGASITKAHRVSTVANGIALRLEDRYSLASRPVVIRNVPDYQAVARIGESRPPFEVLYQGLFNANRHLDVLIESVRLWRPEFRLVIRGEGSPAESDRLRALADAAGERVRIDPPIPMTEMVRAAASSDIGIFALPSSNPQSMYCLPNKMFEYIMAGLAICVSDLPEMRSVVEKYDVGVLISSANKESIADSVNSLSPGLVSEYRSNSRTAAKELNWGVERSRLLEFCDGRGTT